ncbi:hypothetical protein H0H87_003067 [Tephrocybe sp. NHM501043]|nr:hypothetical protein H0H87_003067 [Tephrocybe sp. NHM501043]
MDRKARTWMVITNMSIIITMFLIATALLGIDLANYVTVVASVLIHNPDIPLDTRYGNASSENFDRVVVIDALYGYMTVLGDAIIVWRVYAFWGKGKRRWALLGLCAMLLGSATLKEGKSRKTVEEIELPVSSITSEDHDSQEGKGAISNV